MSKIYNKENNIVVIFSFNSFDIKMNITQGNYCCSSTTFYQFYQF